MFKKANKSQIKIRLAISGASGSGKTYSALAIASNLGSSIALIDTEHGSASRYADRFNFDVCELANFHPARYIEAILAAEEADYETIIIDSLSHAWFAELEIVDNQKNSFGAWKSVRPLERKLIDTMISCKAHIIATMRSKTEWVIEPDKDGKNAPKRVGTSPIQTSGIEYEFDLAGELNQQHILTISKSRCPELQDRTFLNPGKEIAQTLLDWIKPPIYTSWKTQEDALIWAGQQLSTWDFESIQEEFDKLPATNGKKAPAWVERVLQLKEQF